RLVAPAPRISGTAAYTEVLKAVPGEWEDGTTLQYQWLRGETPIDGATAKSYTVAAADIGYRLSVSVTGSKPSYHSATAVSDPTSAVTGPAELATIVPTTPRIEGEPLLPGTLTAVTG